MHVLREFRDLVWQPGQLNALMDDRAAVISELSKADQDRWRNAPLGGGTADEVHNQGEVWCVTLWDLRASLVAKHGAAAGNELILRLVTDGMKLAPANPNFVQARDAILQAELVYSGGANRNELWAAFAKRADVPMPSPATARGSTCATWPTCMCARSPRRATWPASASSPRAAS